VDLKNALFAAADRRCYDENQVSQEQQQPFLQARQQQQQQQQQQPQQQPQQQQPAGSFGILNIAASHAASRPDAVKINIGSCYLYLF
jgi:hypothetical protein